MSKKRISSHAAGDIAKERMSKLLDLSVSAVKNGDDERAKRYVSIARRIGQKTRVPMPEGTKICKKCDLPLIPGQNCRTRIGDGKVKITCSSCGEIKRMPYIREQRE